MKRNVKGATKGKSVTKRTVKAKQAGGRAGATKGGFALKIPSALAKKLTVIAENDTNFKGSNPSRYANFIIKNAVETAKT